MNATAPQQAHSCLDCPNWSQNRSKPS